MKKSATILGSIIFGVSSIFFLLYSFDVLGKRPDARERDDPKFGYYIVEGDFDEDFGVVFPELSSAVNDQHLSIYGNALAYTTKAFTYVDPFKREWIVPAKTPTDGASVPQSLRSIVPGGFTTKARLAAIVHDYYCQRLSENKLVQGSYQAVHDMFYHAMRCSGIGQRKASILYAAVVKFGPPSERPFFMKLFAYEAQNRFNPSIERQPDFGSIARLDSDKFSWENLNIPPSVSSEGFDWSEYREFQLASENNLPTEVASADNVERFDHKYELELSRLRSSVSKEYGSVRPDVENDVFREWSNKINKEDDIEKMIHWLEVSKELDERDVELSEVKKMIDQIWRGD